MAKPGNMKKHVPNYLYHELVLQHSCPGHLPKTSGMGMPHSCWTWYRKESLGHTDLFSCISNTTKSYDFTNASLRVIINIQPEEFLQWSTQLTHLDAWQVSVESDLCSSRPYPAAAIPSLCYTYLIDALITLSRGKSAAADYTWCKCLPSQ